MSNTTKDVQYIVTIKNLETEGISDSEEELDEGVIYNLKQTLYNYFGSGFNYFEFEDFTVEKV